ncbi:hypothetical protein BJ912DRAFT_957772 [Pholiota molesta]|nr:hypothetical protein BJ912DRAFT_957772 [Pholiota molesta]
MSSHDAIYFNVDPRLNASTSTHASDATSATLATLVDPSTPRKDKKHLEGTRLSLQPCPSLASANRILSLSDLPPNHDAPSPIDENTYRRYEHEGKFDSPFNDFDICADYDYIHAIDVLIYGVRPLPDVPMDAARRPSQSRPRRDNSIRRSGSAKGPTQVLKLNAHNTPPVSFNRTSPRKNSFEVCTKAAVKMESRQDHKGERRSIFFQDTPNCIPFRL